MLTVESLAELGDGSTEEKKKIHDLLTVVFNVVAELKNDRSHGYSTNICNLLLLIN